MKDKYKCSVCMRLFNVENALDAYDLGYKKGFLCPFCRSNLIEAGESDDILNLDYGLIFLCSILLIFLGVSNDFLYFDFTSSKYLDEFLTFSSLSIFPVITFIVVNRRVLFKSRIIFTRKINSKSK